jgi:hypothetical protein
MDRSELVISSFLPVGKLFINLTVIAIFSMIYMVIDFIDTTAFNKQDELKGIDFIYFSTVTHSSVGYGDMYPKSVFAKMVVMLHIVLMLFVNLLM